MKALSFLLIAVFANSYGWAQDELPQAVPLKIQEAFIPGGFDSNDRVQITVEGTLPSTCYKVGPYRTEFDRAKNELKIIQYAYKYRGECMAMTVRFQNTMNVGIAPIGQFTVRDGTDDASLGKLPVAAAKTAKADDYLYAPVNEVSINARHRNVTISGMFSQSCMALKDVKMIRESHNVVTALPVSEPLIGVECKAGLYPYSKTISFPFLNDARYLLHVRSLDGQATNKLFTIGEPYL